jgi:hypothetical protein
MSTFAIVLISISSFNGANEASPGVGGAEVVVQFQRLLMVLEESIQCDARNEVDRERPEGPNLSPCKIQRDFETLRKEEQQVPENKLLACRFIVLLLVCFPVKARRSCYRLRKRLICLLFHFLFI